LRYFASRHTDSYKDVTFSAKVIINALIVKLKSEKTEKNTQQYIKLIII